MPPNVAQQPAKPPQVKVTVTHTAPDVRRAAAGAANAAKATGKPSASAGQAKQPAAFNPLGGFLSSGQLADLSNRITKQSTNASLAPLRAQAGQLRNSEATVQGRYAGYTNTGDQVMQGLQQNANNSAASQDNLVAQAAQNTANQIDQTGSAAQTLNGGYLDPQVAAQLQLQRQASGTTLGAAAGAAAGMGANEQNFMANLRASAATRGIEGQQNIASAYARPLSANAAAQQSLLLKEAPTANQLASTLGQQQFTDYATLRGLGLKGEALQLAGQKANQAFTLGQGRNAIGAENAQTAAQRVKSDAAYHQGLLALGQGRLNVQQQNDLANQSIKRIDAQIAQGNLSEKQRHDLTNERIAWQRVANTAKTGNAKVDAQISKITGQAAYYDTLTTVPNAKTGKTVPASNAKIAVQQGLKNDGAEAQAAIELATIGWVQPQTVQALKLQGITLPASLTQAPTKGVKGTAKG